MAESTAKKAAAKRTSARKGTARRATAKDRVVINDEGRSITRVFHPHADTYHDVLTEQVDEWYEQGWQKEPGDAQTSLESYPVLTGDVYDALDTDDFGPNGQ